MSTPLAGDEEVTPVIVGDVIDTAPDEVVNEGDTTVIVETPNDSGDAVDAVVIETTIDQAERIAALEAEIAELRGDVIDAQITAEVAEAIATQAIEADADIIEATDAAIVETVENAEVEDGGFGEDDEVTTDEVAPVSSRIHPLFRPLSDWRNK